MNRLGRSGFILLLAAAVLPVLHAEIVLNRKFSNNRLQLEWEVDPSDTRSVYRIIRNGAVAAEQSPGFTFEMEFSDAVPERETVYQVVKLADGREIDRSQPLTVRPGPELALDSEQGFALSNIFPVTGRSVNFKVTAFNSGSAVARQVEFRVADAQRGELFSTTLPELAPGERKEIAFSFAFPEKGVWNLTFSLRESGARKAVPGASFTEKLRVDDRPFYVHWYGAVPDLKYVNLRQGTVADMEESRKHGAYAGVCGGCHGLNAGDLLDNLLALTSPGFDALYIDEISADLDPTGVLLEVLPKLRQARPELFIAVWNIGDQVSDRIAEQLKAGIIDLVMLEIYIRPGENIQRLDAAAEAMRRQGIADKVIIGLVTNRTWSGGASDQEYIKSLQNQMRHLRRVFPESPGVAFWDAIAPPGMPEAAEAMIEELYFQQPF